ncbi:MAG TPA: hypothetical protein DDZ80_07175 [Cyanobacteria bacterium UBA8803]|nr:hypothetical protein [Cyanobacteria bacterium UBA8803]
MTQPIRGLLIGLLLLSAIAGCGKTNPQNNQTFQEVQPTSTQATPQSSTAPKQGWKTIAGAGVSLSLPEQYEGGNPSKDINKIAEKLEAIRPGYSARIESIKQNPEAIALLAFDAQNANSEFMANVNIAKEQVPNEVTIEQYLQAATQQLAAQYKILEQKVVPLEPYQAGRIVAESTVGETTIKQLFYTVKKGNMVWLVTYSTTPAEFDQRLPNFEESIRTLKIEN